MATADKKKKVAKKAVIKNKENKAANKKTKLHKKLREKQVDYFNTHGKWHKTIGDQSYTYDRRNNEYDECEGVRDILKKIKNPYLIKNHLLLCLVYQSGLCL